MAQGQPRSTLEIFERLLQQAREGSAAALHDVMALASDYLQRQTPALNLKPDERASDFFQEALVAAIRKLPQFRGQTEGQFCRWLHAILANTILAHRRVCAEQHTTVVDPAAPGGPLLRRASSELPPDEALARSEQERRFRHCAQFLPEHYKQILRLRFTRDLSFEEIGTALGISAAAASERCYRALRHFGRLLAKQGMAVVHP